MNIIDILKVKFKALSDLDSSIDSNSVLLHIDRAYEYFKRGMEDGDDQYYTDVIYRCNQAFEGCSRLSYKLLAGKNDDELRKTKAYKIEEYLIKQKILNDRVYPLFKNYRESWRNESAHNFRLFFSENEAFIAISNVVSYAYVLFSQMIIKVAHDIKQKELEEKNKIAKIKIAKRDSVLSTIADSLFEYFMNDGNIDIGAGRIKDSYKRALESKFIGELSGFIESKFDDTKVRTEAKLGKSGFRGDLLLENNDINILVEVKSNKIKVDIMQLEYQLSKYLEGNDTINGLIVILYDRIGKKSEPKIEKRSFKVGSNKTLPLYLVSL